MSALILTYRVHDYIKHGFDVKYLRDPDGGVNLLRKKAQLGVLENQEPEVKDSFPKEGFQPDIKALPKISFGTVWRFMIEGVECKKQLSTAKPLVKGFNFFKSGHVLSIGHLQQNGKHYIKSQVLPSMKKDKVYTCYLVISSLGKMLRAHCKCPAGIDGRCNHVASTLFALENYCKVREKLDESDESCTSKPCKWNVPRKRKGAIQPINEMTFVKHDYTKEKKIRKLHHSPVNANQNACRDENKSRFFEMMKEYQRVSGNTVAWTHILPQEVKKLQDVKDSLLSPVKCHPVSAKELKEKFEKAKRNLMVDDLQRQDIEEQTRGQSNTELWHRHRQPRITATKCYRVAVQRESTSPTKIIKDILGYNKAYQSKSMEEGLKMEDQIINDYKLLKQSQGDEGITVSKCGFFVSKEHGYLGASPDGLVHDPSASDSEGLIEVKYVQTSKDETLEKALLRKSICKKNSNALRLNDKHKYFYQVHQQMFVTGRKWTDFVVKGSGCDSLFCERVHFSIDRWKSILPKLESFFNDWIVPELVYPRVKYGIPKLNARSV